MDWGNGMLNDIKNDIVNLDDIMRWSYPVYLLIFIFGSLSCLMTLTILYITDKMLFNNIINWFKDWNSGY